MTLHVTKTGTSCPQPPSRGDTPRVAATRGQRPLRLPWSMQQQATYE
jgi:hypothetical protein